MAAPDESWIQASIERLEQLEQQRERHEAALESVSDVDALAKHSQAIEALDEEIKALYARLEAAAEHDAGDEDGDTRTTAEFARNAAQTPVAAPQPVKVAAASLDELANPFGAPAGATAAAAAGGFGSGSSGGADPFTSATSAYDDDGDRRSGGGMWVLAAVVVVAIGGAGAWLATQGGTAAKPAEPVVPAAAPQVISATPVPPDTQGPKAAKGGDADVTPQNLVKSSGRSTRPGDAGGSRDASDAGDPDGGSRKRAKGLDVGKTDDPLAGLN
jgi:uncharacterized coiled-coil protein SlyX